MAFTMFTSTRTEKIMKGQKKYYLLPYEKNEKTIYHSAPYSIREREKAKKLVLKKDLSKCRKSSIDMSEFG